MPTPTPIRIQRKRTKGWKMPENTIYVGRPTEWGNEWRPKTGRTIEDCVRFYAAKYKWVKKSEIKRVKKELGGKNLACWCPLDKPCHADVLLKIANHD